ncbi:VOC family protein [Amycolatopsis albispora]|nr:VOC family protein [Amycolatopsis albispora]
MSTKVLALTIDCHDAGRLAGFWCAALDYREIERWQDAHGVEYLTIGDPADADGLRVLFQPVPEGKQVKNRLHLDLGPVERDQRAEVDRLIGLGASLLDEAPEHPWIVLADPEGNEFCVLPQQDQ